jgi:hypothetical protein
MLPWPSLPGWTQFYRQIDLILAHFYNSFVFNNLAFSAKIEHGKNPVIANLARCEKHWEIKHFGK